MDTLSIFVDESGRFQYPDNASRFYILGMVFHDQSLDISSLVADLERSESELGLEGHCFHAGRYRLFQLADLVCTLHLIELRLAHGIPMTPSEMRFFGGPRDFKRNVLRKIKAKEI